MKFNRFILASLLSILCCTGILSQTREIDSLLLVLKNAKEDTNKVNTLNIISNRMEQKNEYNNGLKYAIEAEALSKEIQFKNGEALASRNIGLSYFSLTKYQEARQRLFNSLSIAKELGNTELVALDYVDIGLMYTCEENYVDGLKYYYIALKLFEQIKDKKHIAWSFFSISTINENQENYREAMMNCRKALSIYDELGGKADIADIANIKIRMAELYFYLNDNTEALKADDSAFQIYRSLNDEGGIAASLTISADIFQKQGDSAWATGNKLYAIQKYNQALINYTRAEVGYKKVPDWLNIPYSNINLGNINIKLKNYSSARSYLYRGMKLSDSTNNKTGIRDSYLSLSKLDSAEGNYLQSYKDYKKYIFYRDSIVNEESLKKSTQANMQYEFDKKEDSLKQKQVLTDTKLQAQRNQSYFYWGGIVVLSVLSFFVFLNFRNQKKLNRLAAETHASQKSELELQHQQTVLNERLRISTELHDEVGATLSGIAMYSHLTKEQIKKGKGTEIERSLNVMQQSSAQMVDKLSDIVWLINPEQDSLQKLVTRLEEYARDMAAIKNIQVKINVPEKIDDIHLPVENRRNIYLFCKEAINNAVKYSNASLLELTIKETDGKLEFSVRDNGKGFDAVMVRRGNGLENMQKRADEIGAKLILQSKENEGASVSLQCKTSD